MNNFQKYILNKSLAESLYNQNVDLQPFVDQVESGNYDEQQIISELLNTAGKVIGAVGGGIARGINNFVQGTKTGYNWANPQQQSTSQQQNNTQQNSQQQNGNQQANPQQQQQKAQVVSQLQKQLQQLQSSLPQLTQQLQSLAQMG